MTQLLSRIKVKVCGMTQADQVESLVILGVSAIGVILHAKSPRIITVDQALEIRQRIPAFISMVGVFVDCPIEKVNDYSDRIGLDLVQLHGAESMDYASQLNTHYVKAIRAKNLEQVARDIECHPSARAILLDPYVKGQHGGTGKQLDTTTWPTSNGDSNKQKKLILAGGLSVENLLTSVNKFKPYAVDLNSGVEISPGIKDIDSVAECLMILGR